MGNNFGINNKIELYKRLTPALTCKERELTRANINYIKKEDIWNYLLKTKWDNNKGLDLAMMVDDILNLDNDQLIKVVNNKFSEVPVSDSSEDEIELL